MKHSFLIATATLALVACVDTTGISATSSKTQHPSTQENAVVTVTEYGDLQCPACKAAFTQLVEPLVANYGKKIRLEFAQFPLTSIHQYAMEAAEASECAADQGKFWEFLHLAYTEQEKLSKDQLDVWGEQLQLDMDLYGRCRASHIKRDVIMADYEKGKELGVQGTPSFFVNGQKVDISNDSLKTLQSAIDAQIGAAGTRL